MFTDILVVVSLRVLESHAKTTGGEQEFVFPFRVQPDWLAFGRALYLMAIFQPVLESINRACQKKPSAAVRKTLSAPAPRTSLTAQNTRKKERKKEKKRKEIQRPNDSHSNNHNHSHSLVVAARTVAVTNLVVWEYRRTWTVR